MTVLFKWDEDWADEFDMTGIRVLSDEEMKEFEMALDTINYPIEASFGTNESYIFESAEEVRQGFTIRNLEENEYQVLQSLFGNNYNDSVFFGWDPIDNIVSTYRNMTN